MSRPRFPRGARVRIAAPQGCESHLSGVVVAPELRGDGVPLVAGAYRPFRQRLERFIIFDDGRPDVVDVRRLAPSDAPAPSAALAALRSLFDAVRGSRRWNQDVRGSRKLQTTTNPWCHPAFRDAARLLGELP